MGSKSNGGHKQINFVPQVKNLSTDIVSLLITNNKNIFGNVGGILYLCIMISETLIARAFGGLMLVILLSTLI